MHLIRVPHHLVQCFSGHAFISFAKDLLFYCVSGRFSKICQELCHFLRESFINGGKTRSPNQREKIEMDAHAWDCSSCNSSVLCFWLPHWHLQSCTKKRVWLFFLHRCHRMFSLHSLYLYLILQIKLYASLWKWMNSPVLQWSNTLGQSLQWYQYRKEQLGVVSSVTSLFSAHEFLQEFFYGFIWSLWVLVCIWIKISVLQLRSTE